MVSDEWHEWARDCTRSVSINARLSIEQFGARVGERSDKLLASKAGDEKRELPPCGLIARAYNWRRRPRPMTYHL
ncbi:hypothetical protein Poly59_31820 [Rubripirellula reticaptiva]|uniref:Uncharacterized protein n=1 Tax=Rubripirellula reticaptiva TaxID=2528013 RepID=A0A5C6EVS2_9BACT|nr:hypothetical protein Poly59_31820 [Rubripirellula reticaptiva]